jgi:tetratricopeptide (TPR) repeat protein
MFKKFAVIASLVLASAVAMAMPKPSEVKAAVDSGNYAKAESMLKEVLQERNTAIVHYQLGQVYSRENRHKEALNEFQQAQALDPSLKFAKDADAFIRNLRDEQAIVANGQAPVVATRTVPVQHPVPVQQAVPMGVHQTDYSGAKTVFIFMFGILILGGVCYGIYVFFEARAEKKRKEDEVNERKAANMKKLVEMSSELDDATLIAKTSGFSDADSSKIVANIKEVQQSVRLLIESIKGGNDVSKYNVMTLRNNADAVIEQSKNGIKIKEAPAPETKAAAPAPSYSSTRTPHARDAKRSSYKTPAPSPAPAPSQTTVVNHYHQDSGSDFVTGVMVGEMMSRPTVVVEQPVVYERPVYRAPAPAPSYDFGRDDDNDSYNKRSSSGSSSFDWGSSNSGSDSYSDSGSSSYDSGSSSSDSY